MNFKKIMPLLVLSLANVMAFSIMFPVLAPFIRSIGLPDVSYGVVTASYFFALMFGSFSMGKLADKYGRKNILLISNAGTLVGWGLMFASAFATPRLAFALLVISRLVDGFTGGNTSIVQAMASDMSSVKERTKVFGVMGSSFGVGMIIGPLLGGLSYEWLGFAGTAVLSFLMTSVAMAFLWFGISEPSRRLKVRKMDYSKIWRPALVRFLSSIVFSSFTTIFPLFLMDRFHAGASGIGLMFTAIGLMSIFNQSFVVPEVEKRIGRMASLSAGAVLLGLSFVLVYFSHSLLSLLVSSYAFNLGGTLFVPIIKSWLVEAGPAGEAMGIDESVRAMSRTFAPIIASLLYQSLGSFSLVAIGPVSGVAILLILVFALGDRKV